MNPTEIIVAKVQSTSRFEILQLLRERISKPCEPSHLHPHGEVLPLHMRRADVGFVRPAISNLGYNLRDSWWGVPRCTVVLSVVAKQLD